MFNMFVNHLTFAYDICVFSPNISGLHRLLKICCDYAAEHGFVFICKKIVGVVFHHKEYIQHATPAGSLNGVGVNLPKKQISW